MSIISEIKRELVSDPEFIELLRPTVEEIIRKRKPLFYTRDEAAEILRVTTRTVDARLADGSLPFKKFGTRVLIPEDALIS